MAKLRSEKLQDMQLWVEQIENGVCYELGTNNAEKASERLDKLLQNAIDAWDKLDEAECFVTYDPRLNKNIVPLIHQENYSLYKNIVEAKTLLSEAIRPLKSWRVNGMFAKSGLQEDENG